MGRMGGRCGVGDGNGRRGGRIAMVSWGSVGVVGGRGCSFVGRRWIHHLPRRGGGCGVARVWAAGDREGTLWGPRGHLTGGVVPARDGVG